MSLRRSLLAAPAAAVLLLAPAVQADDDVYSIDAHIIAAGASAQSMSACFRMNAVIAEPLAGFSSSTDFTLSAGFYAVAAPVSDDIFFSGFEDCTP